MEKSAIQSVTWHASAAGYQISKQTGRGAVATPVNDESAAWNAWLEHVSSFAFQSRDGCHLTVLKEQRGHGRAYWTAYRSVGGKLKRKYLGASTRVTLARLEQAAAALTASKTATAAAYPLPPKDSSFTVECDQHRTPWQASFVATKFFVPTPSHTLISRPRLVALLRKGSRRSSPWSQRQRALAKPRWSRPGSARCPKTMLRWPGFPWTAGTMSPSASGPRCSPRWSGALPASVGPP